MVLRGLQLASVHTRSDAEGWPTASNSDVSGRSDHAAVFDMFGVRTG